MSVIESVTVVRYRTKAAIGERRRKLRGTKRLAYRDAAWARIRTRCSCAGDWSDRKFCRYHDTRYRATPEAGPYDVWGDRTIGPPEPHPFEPPRIWSLPRSDEPGYWDYGRAVAFRLARFYAYLDRRPTPEPKTRE